MCHKDTRIQENTRRDRRYAFVFFWCAKENDAGLAFLSYGLVDALVDDCKDGSAFDKGLNATIDTVNLPLQKSTGGAIESSSTVGAIRTRNCPPCAGQKVEVVVDQNVDQKCVGGVGCNQGLDVGVGTHECFE